MLLSEYALTPDIFDSTSYSSDEVAGIQLQRLKEVMVAEGLVRDLREGNWFDFFKSTGRSWHMRGKELLKRLAKQNRLRRSHSALADEPATDQEWCKEALASHTSDPLAGIVATHAVAELFPNEPLVARIDQLASVPWWTGRSSSVRLARKLVAYAEHLDLILKCANSVMFIDPHLNPSQSRYRDFTSLLLGTSGRTPAPKVEAHRVCYFESQNKRNQKDEAGWREFFGSWIVPLQGAGVSVEVFIWNDFHDRYVISDLAGISLPNGFDTTTDSASITTWTRLGRNERDDIQREFDPASNRHALRHRFRLP
jgi:hypothetical protein